MSKHWIPVVLVISLALVGADARADVTSTFDTGLEGWTGTQATVSHQATGGNTGGFLQALDPDNGAMIINAPAAFLGDLSAYNDGIISFDALRLEGGTTPNLPVFGTVNISDGTTTLSLDMVAGDPSTSWTTYSTGFDAASWGVAPATWSTVIGNVTSFNINAEYVTTIGADQSGFDNIGLDAKFIPEPGTLALLGLGGLALVGYTRRKRRAKK